MNDHPENTTGPVRTLVVALAVLISTSTALLWGWNTFATEVLDLPAIRFKHALALELIVLAMAAVVPFTWRLFARPAPPGRML
ncbi:MAG: hypothetical protein KDH15_19675 [Rhodocyclaceae bacterium]|nr:hypothetical protein [Rhodocyclaceae bacterium]